MSVEPISIREQLRVDYASALTAVQTDAAALRDEVSGKVMVVQAAPATPLDAGVGDTVKLICVDLPPGSRLQLAPTPTEAPATSITVRTEGNSHVITNGLLAVKVPADGYLEPPFPGPVEQVCINGAWLGKSRIAGVPLRGWVRTEIESIGPAFVQWRTTYQWGCDNAFTFIARWAAGADTLMIVEDMMEDSDAAVEFMPYGQAPSDAWIRGGGERRGPLEKLSFASIDPSRRQEGWQTLNWISHISYFNQWNQSWVGFNGGGDNFVGVFSAYGGSWQRRGFMRIEIVEDHTGCKMLRSPLRRGRRFYGLLLSTPQAAGMIDPEVRVLLNRRKTQLSDLRLDKVRTWELNPPLEDRKPQLVRDTDLVTFRQRLAADASIVAAIDRLTTIAEFRQMAQAIAVALFRDDHKLVGQLVHDQMLDYAEKSFPGMGEGGLDRLSIFDGRGCKRMAFDVDVLWTLGLLSEDQYCKIRHAFLGLAYMYADADFCNYADFWQPMDADDGIAQAMKDGVGDCPVPPNFSSEFFSTTAVVAELYPRHPLSRQWRQWAIGMCERYLETFYAPDGTYHESVNYHTHAINELVLQFYPLYIKGAANLWDNPRVKGSFRHFMEIQVPPVREGIANTPWYHAVSLADPQPPRAPLINDGNSGSEGCLQDVRTMLTLAASVYKDSDPAFARELMWSWTAAGRPLLDSEHPMLSLLTLDPAMDRAEPAYRSTWRHSMGLISKARQADGSPVWCEFRAGSATHHMDFDQGNLNLVAFDAILLGDFGYHAHDAAGKPLVPTETWLHNTVVYSANRRESSGYTGLERAPEPLLVHTGDDFDWAVHRIVNNNYRTWEKMSYRDMVPAPTTVHVRHYLFVKPDYFLIWDTFERAHQPSTFWLHPHAHRPMEQLSPATFRSGKPGQPHLLVQFIQPEAVQVIENAPLGALWSFGVQNPTGRPYMTLLVPQVQDRKVTATLEGDHLVRVAGKGLADRIALPSPGTPELPQIRRGN